MNELDNLEDVYFGKKQVNEKEATHLKGLYLYCWAMKPPAKPTVHVPYNLMVFLVKMAPKDAAEQFIAEKLRSYGYLQKNQLIDDALKQRIEYASNWLRDFEEIKETPVTLKEDERKALTDLISVLATTEDPDMIQNGIFNAAKNSGLQPRDFFKTLYTILMGAPQGPRLGPYVLAMGKQNVVAALQRALA